MGRVARYKKVKSVDPFAKARTWTDDVGDTSNIRRIKKRSKTAQKMKDQKNKRLHGKNADKKRGNNDGFDLPPDGEDEFDMSDLIGSVKKEKLKSDDLLKGNNPILENAISTNSSINGKLASKVKKVDALGVKDGSGQLESNSNQSKKNSKTTSKGMEITVHTPTREIIAACANPKTQQQASDEGGNTKQAKRKAFFEQKKLKKRKRKDEFEDDNDDYDTRTNTISSVTRQSKSQSATQKVPVARSVIDDQVERPPIFSALPRGATSKKKKLAVHKEKNEDSDKKADRIRKEQQALEAMRERVMKQYAILRESRRR